MASTPLLSSWVYLPRYTDACVCPMSSFGSLCYNRTLACSERAHEPERFYLCWGSRFGCRSLLLQSFGEKEERGEGTEEGRRTFKYKSIYYTSLCFKNYGQVLRYHHTSLTQSSPFQLMWMQTWRK